jgi:hypothetical protein
VFEASVSDDFPEQYHEYSPRSTRDTVDTVNCSVTFDDYLLQVILSARQAVCIHRPRALSLSGASADKTCVVHLAVASYSWVFGAW